MRRLFLAVAALLPCCVMAQVPKERVCNAAGLCAEVTTGAPAADSPALNVRSVGGGGGGTSSSFGATFPADGTAAGAKVVSSPPTYSAGNMEAPTLDTAGNLRVNVVTGGGGGGTSSTFGATFPASGTAAGFTDGTNMVAGKVMTTTPGASEPGIVVRPVGGSGSAPGGVEAGGSGTLNGDGQTVECYTGDTTGVYEGCFFRLTDSSLTASVYFEGTVNGSTWEGFDCFYASFGPGATPPIGEKTTQFYASYFNGVYYCQDSPSGGVFHGYQGIRVRMANYVSGSVAVVSSRSKRVETKPIGVSYNVSSADRGSTNSYTGTVATGDVTQKVREMPHSYTETQYFNGNPATGLLWFGVTQHSPVKSVSVTFSNYAGSGFDVRFLVGCSTGLSCVGGYRPVACWRTDSSGGTPLWSEGYVTATTGNPRNKSFTCPWFYGDAPFIVQNLSGLTVGPMDVTVIGHRESGMNIGMSSLMDASTGALASISGGALSVSGTVSISGTSTVRGEESHSNTWASSSLLSPAFYAEAEAAALDATNVAGGDSTRAKADIEGRILVRTDHPYTWSCTRDAQTASGVCQASATAGYFITDVLLSNGATAQNIKVVYGTGSTCGTGQTVIVPTTYLPVNGGAVLPLRTPFRIPSTVDICCIISGATAHSCRVSGHRGQ